ncbi:hypothetical protein [Aminipila luticellarii]|uniref:DUF3791 domain-containing protein n=1 Tax=Aminipila luticellarii TaxID=2507160 RepID=A0A410PWG1_9FIRM|nr:hypothetical protein [Aminipila luticellarii]QAT43288.1 hypothetical protein EQM06_08685 [Aminipila luticellarii]
MNKKEQLMEYITQDIVAFLIEDYDLSMDEAMHKVYTSEIYGKLTDEETGLYLQGSAYIYDMFKEELSNGQIVQAEY